MPSPSLSLVDHPDRVDPMDRGAEYRSLIGLPGGAKHSSYPAVEAAASNAGFSLLPGKGNDPDTLGKKLVYVYDSNTFPFYQAEVYHQFHVSALLWISQCFDHPMTHSCSFIETHVRLIAC